MPVFEIKSPEGEVFEITAPEGASEKDILEYAQSNFSQAKSVGSGKMDISRPQAALQSLIQGGTFGFGDELQAGIAGGYGYLFGGIPFKEGYQQALQMGRDELSAAREKYPLQSIATELAGGLSTGSAGVKALGTLAPKSISSLAQTTAAARPTATATVAGLGSGGLYGAGSAEEGERIQGATVGAILGGTGGYVGGYITSKAAPRLGALGRSILGDTAEDVAELSKRTGQSTSSIDDIAGATLEPKQIKALGSLTKEQQARSQILEKAGVPVDRQTAGMITRDPKIWQFEQNIRGIQEVGDEIRNRYVQVNGLIRSKLDEIAEGLGGKATTPYEAGESVTEAVIKKSREMQDEIGGLYTKIRSEFGEDIGMNPSRVIGALDEVSDDAYTDKIVTSVSRKLKRYGVLKSDGNINPDVNLTVKQAEELRKFTNKLRGDPQTDYAVAKVIDSLDDDVIETAGSDVFSHARDKARLKFKEFESKILKNISQQKLVSDDVLKRVAYQGKVKDIQKLKDSLLTGNEQQISRGVQAWNDIKLQTLQDVIDKSTSAGGKLHGASFSKNLNKIGKERLETIFSPEELTNIDLIKKALEFTTIEVPESVVNYSGTGAATTNNALMGIIKGSSSGKFLESVSDAINKTPLIGTLSSPVTAAMKAGGRGLQQTATRQAIKNVMNPQKSLGRITIDPRYTGSLGQAAGVISSQPEIK